MIALFAVTIAVTNDAARRITTHEEEEEIDPRIMLGNTIVNLFVDIFASRPFSELMNRLWPARAPLRPELGAGGVDDRAWLST